MTNRQRFMAVWAAMFFATLSPAFPAGAITKIVVLYVDQADDEAYRSTRGYEGLYANSSQSPFPGAALAINDAK